MVSWKSIRSVRNNITATQRMQMSKIMHGWLPVMHMQVHTSRKPNCPGCPCADETIDHMFRCQNKQLSTKRDALDNSLSRKGMKLGVPRAIMEALSKLIYDYTNAKTPSIPAHQGIATAVRAQIRIGLHLLPQGFIATEWIQVIEDFSIGRPERKVASILKTLWLDFTDQLWRNRNAIAHAKENLNSLAEAQEH